MLLTELNNRLETTQVDETQLWELHKLYTLLNLEKDDFAKIVDTIGVEKLLGQSSRYNMLCKAEYEFKRKEKYINSKKRLEDLNKEQGELERFVNKYESDLSIK